MKEGQYLRIEEENKSEKSGDVHVRREKCAKIFITEERRLLEKVNTCRKGLNQFVHGVLNSSRETEKIAASIDDIARQANVIALMAAVEAERAEQEGRELSIMAKGARDMAMRSAETVKDTRRHIEYMVSILKSFNHVTQLSMEVLPGETGRGLKGR